MPALVLWDCHGKDPNSLLDELRAYNLSRAFDNHIVLFNVPSGMGLNRKLVLEGIQGLFYPHDSLDTFMKGVSAVIEGKLWLSREMMTKCIFEDTTARKPSESEVEKLTQRQTEILAQVAVGASNEEIAEKLFISPHTVKNHLYTIFKKINVPSRLQAALWAASNL